MLNQRDRANEVSKVRAGTRCRICGEPITAEDFRNYNVVSTDGGCLGGIIYGHAHCCRKRDYYYEHLARNKKATYSGIQFGVEFEINQTTTPEERLYLYACYGLICTHYCTVQEEFKSGINQGLHGVKAYLEGIEKVIDIVNGDNCGSHVNISLSHWSDEDAMEVVREHKEYIFAPLVKAMRGLEASERVAIFGRDFGNFRRYTEHGFEHGDWLQIKDFGLEFRISRYKNPTQFAHLIMLYAEICKTLDRIYIQAPTYRNAVKCGSALVKLLDKHASGEAKYQRSERNK